MTPIAPPAPKHWPGDVSLLPPPEDFIRSQTALLPAPPNPPSGTEVKLGQRLFGLKLLPLADGF